MRFHTWRKLWLNLAVAEKELGLPVSDEAISEMKANLVRLLSDTGKVDGLIILSATWCGAVWRCCKGGEEAKARCYGARTYFWDSCSSSCWYHPVRFIYHIHSLPQWTKSSQSWCYLLLCDRVGDSGRCFDMGTIDWEAWFHSSNADLIFLREALTLVLAKLVVVIDRLSKFAEQYKDLPTLGFTHFQPAQLTTVGKRATLWIQVRYCSLSCVKNNSHWRWAL